MRLPAIAVVVANLTFHRAQPLKPRQTRARAFSGKFMRGSKVLYLAGSVHALGADAYPLSAAYENAFAAAGTLVEEINLAEAEQLASAPMLLAKGMYTDGRTFEGAVSKETATRVASRLKETGIPPEMIRMMKPWMVMLMITALRSAEGGARRRARTGQVFLRQGARRRQTGGGARDGGIADRSLRQDAGVAAGADAAQHADRARRAARTAWRR